MFWEYLSSNLSIFVNYITKKYLSDTVGHDATCCFGKFHATLQMTTCKTNKPSFV